jgi:hypothetical protein
MPLNVSSTLLIFFHLTFIHTNIAVERSYVTTNNRAIQVKILKCKLQNIYIYTKWDS